MQHPSGIIISSRPDLALRAIDSPEWHWGNSSEQAAYKTGRPRVRYSAFSRFFTETFYENLLLMNEQLSFALRLLHFLSLTVGWRTAWERLGRALAAGSSVSAPSKPWRAGAMRGRSLPEGTFWVHSQFSQILQSVWSTFRLTGKCSHFGERQESTDLTFQGYTWFVCSQVGLIFSFSFFFF